MALCASPFESVERKDPLSFPWMSFSGLFAAWAYRDLGSPVSLDFEVVWIEEGASAFSGPVAGCGGAEDDSPLSHLSRRRRR